MFLHLQEWNQGPRVVCLECNRWRISSLSIWLVQSFELLIELLFSWDQWLEFHEICYLWRSDMLWLWFGWSGWLALMIEVWSKGMIWFHFCFWVVGVEGDFSLVRWFVLLVALVRLNEWHKRGEMKAEPNWIRLNQQFFYFSWREMNSLNSFILQKS